MPTHATVFAESVHKGQTCPKRTQFATLLQKKQNLFEKRLTGSKQRYKKKEGKMGSKHSHCSIRKFFLLKHLSVLKDTHKTRILLKYNYFP